jgi:hypothetical protein
VNTTIIIAIVGVAGVVSAALYLARRKWFDALLVAVAATALGLFAADLRLPGEAAHTLTIDASKPPTSFEGVRAVTVLGDGLRAAQWNDLPALPLEWKAPQGLAIRLDFPRQVALGRVFRLNVAREDKSAAQLELLAENGKVLAQVRNAGDLTVEWTPPVAERVLLKARLRNASGAVLAEGPLPFIVHEPAPLQVVGRFGAPSFDLRVLNDLLAGSGALLDWQVQLSRAITRSETAREEMTAPNLMLIDAAWFERMGANERSALLKRVADGMSLLVLGANANDPGLWSRSLQLPLRPQAAGSRIEAPLEMPLAALAPAAREAGPWQGSNDMLWTRDWQQGRIGWLGVAEWHRHAIAEPRALALWWQGVIDRVRVERRQDTEWLAPDELPLVGQRIEICARGVAGELALPDLKQTLRWQPRADRVDTSCVALWPQKTGWMNLRDAKAGEHALYVYAPADWRPWQIAQKRDATARYAARTHDSAAHGPTRPMPVLPFALLFVAAMLLLWWRERR